jgi:hypothetical protein
MDDRVGERHAYSFNALSASYVVMRSDVVFAYSAARLHVIYIKLWNDCLNAEMVYFAVPSQHLTWRQ